MAELLFFRSGERPLQFEGEVLAAVTTDRGKQSPAGRWYEARIARTVGGQYAVEVCYHTAWQDVEDDVDFAFAGAEDDVIDWLQTFDPCGPVAGYPPGRQFEERQARLEDAIRARWRTALTELLAVFPPERVA